MTRDYPKKGSGEKKKRNPKRELAMAVEALMREPFPERSADDTLDQLHAELVLFDSRVGDTVMDIINGERVPREDLRADDEMRERLEALAASADANVASDARTYLAYLEGLEHLITLARVAIGLSSDR
ncbi:MAG TPA: hypothetical protein VGL77_19995 [Armatimonadota bacterium]